MESELLSILIGVGLSAACGFRIFVPLLVLSVAARADYLTLADSFQWMESTTALLAFGTATVLEIGAYYIPLVDNLLDGAAAPSAVVAGVLATGSQVADMHPMLAWSVAIVAGGGAAGAVQGLTTIARQLSTLATAGFGNPLFSTAEAGASLGMALLALLLPVAAASLILVLLVLLYLAAKKLLSRKRTAAAAA